MLRRRDRVLTVLFIATMLPIAAAAQSPDPVAALPRLRIVVSPPVAPLVDAYLDGGPITGLTDVATGSVSGYVDVPAGAHQLDLFPDGSDPSTGAPFATMLIDFGDTGARTVAVLGDGTATILDDMSVPPVTGALLRLVNLDTDAGPVDVWFGDRLLALGLPTRVPSWRFLVPAGTSSLVANAPADRLSVFASEDVVLGDGNAVTAFMVPTSERAAWLLAVDAAPTVEPDPTASVDPDALEWRTLPVHECELMIMFTTDGETSSTRPTGTARVRVPASLRRGLALFHYPVMAEGDPLSGWALGPDGWTCVRHLMGDFDTFDSGLTIRSAGAGRAAAATCTALACDPAVGDRDGRFIAYGSGGSGGLERPAEVDHGVPGTIACAYHRRYRAEGFTECRGVAARDGRRNVPRRTPDGSTWLAFSRDRGGDTVVGAVGIDCGGGSCTPHLIECKLRPEDRTLCDQSLQVMLDPDRVRVPREDATLACPGSVTL